MENRNILPGLLKYLIAAVIFTTGCKQERSADVETVKKVMSEYRDAWMRGDQQGVLDRISDEVVLHMPSRSGKPVAGKVAVAEFWFPASDVSYPITAYEVSHEQVSVDNDVAIYTGISRLSWHTLRGEIRSDSSTAYSEFLNVLRREHGQWKLQRIMYNLKDSTYSPVR